MTYKQADNNNPSVGIVEWFRPGEYDRVRQVIKDLNQLGIKKLRTGISWADWYVEGTDKWLDWLLPELNKSVEILPCFLYTPPSIGIVAKASSPPIDLKAYADFIDIMITRYGKYFEWVELWNEPNNRIEYDFTQDYSWMKFCEMIGNAGYWAQKRGKKALLGGMSPIDPNWLQMMFDRGVIGVVDAIGIHGFPDTFDQQWNGWEEQISAVRQVMEKNNSTAELWITEAGFSTWQHDEVKQWQEFKNVLNTGVERVYWYSAFDLDPNLSTVGGFHLDEREYHFGLKKINGSEKLLYKLLRDGGLNNIENHPHIKKRFPVLLKEKYSLITGGAGFIGTNLAKHLLNSKKKVMVFDSLARPGVENNLRWLYENYNGNLHVQVADIRDERAVRESVKHADEIFNFSAQVAVTTSLEDPVHDFDVNIRGALNLLECIRKSGRSIPLIFSSTNKVYGDLADLEFISNGSRYYPADKNLKIHGISEARPLDFHSPYGCSKGAADQYVIDYSRSFGLKTTVFRMSCIYGPYQFGTEDQGWVAHFIISMLDNKPITIYGDGKQVRDVLYVDDLVNAFILGMENIDKLTGNGYNIGGGPENTVSLLEILNKMKNLSLKEPTIKFKDWRTGDQQYYVSDIRKFSEATGWRPEVPVDNGIRMLVNWLSENRGIDLKERINKKKIIIPA
jgi:CDP-paratose 2-epimerase